MIAIMKKRFDETFALRDVGQMQSSLAVGIEPPRSVGIEPPRSVGIEPPRSVGF